MTFLLYVCDDDDLQLYFGVTGYDIDAATINEWNLSCRLSRAYLDEEVAIFLYSRSPRKQEYSGSKE